MRWRIPVKNSTEVAIKTEIEYLLIFVDICYLLYEKHFVLDRKLLLRLYGKEPPYQTEQQENNSSDYKIMLHKNKCRGA